MTRARAPAKPRTHLAPSIAKAQRLEIALVGCGGNGSRFAVELKNIALSILAWRGLHLHVTLYDPDTVSASNLTRQSFYPSDQGRNKAEVLAGRLNRSYGLEWRSEPRAPKRDDLYSADIIVTCVDTRKSRAEILRCIGKGRARYHLDLGNDDTFGQAVIGVIGKTTRTLAAPNEIFPELFDTTLPEDNRPSCGTIEALRNQDLSINLLVVAAAHNLLWRLLKDARLEVQGYYVNIHVGMTALPIKSSNRTHAAPSQPPAEETPCPTPPRKKPIRCSTTTARSSLRSTPQPAAN